jgi:hypothetical protein
MSCQRLLSHSLHTAACCSGQGQRHCFTNSLLHIITRALILHRNDACLTQIPTAKNIPLGEVQKAVALTPKEFEAKYGFRKPTKDNLVVVYCRAGVRSEQVRTLHTLQSLPLNCVRFSGQSTAVAVVRASKARSSKFWAVHVSQQKAAQQTQLSSVGSSRHHLACRAACLWTVACTTKEHVTQSALNVRVIWCILIFLQARDAHISVHCAHIANISGCVAGRPRTSPRRVQGHEELQGQLARVVS